MNELSIFTLYFLRAWSICLNKICYLSKKKKKKNLKKKKKKKKKGNRETYQTSFTCWAQ